MIKPKESFDSMDQWKHKLQANRMAQTCSRVFIVSIGYKAVSTTTPAVPPAITPSANKCDKTKYWIISMKKKNYFTFTHFTEQKFQADWQNKDTHLFPPGSSLFFSHKPIVYIPYQTKSKYAYKCSLIKRKDHLKKHKLTLHSFILS